MSETTNQPKFNIWIACLPQIKPNEDIDLFEMFAPKPGWTMSKHATSLLVQLDGEPAIELDLFKLEQPLCTAYVVEDLNIVESGLEMFRYAAQIADAVENNTNTNLMFIWVCVNDGTPIDGCKPGSTRPALTLDKINTFIANCVKVKNSLFAMMISSIE